MGPIARLFSLCQHPKLSSLGVLPFRIKNGLDSYMKAIKRKIDCGLHAVDAKFHVPVSSFPSLSSILFMSPIYKTVPKPKVVLMLLT